MELAMQDSLKLQQEQTPPLLPSLLSSPQDPIQARPQEADTCRADHFARVFGLNEDQAAALKATSGWFGKGTYEVLAFFRSSTTHALQCLCCTAIFQL